MLLDKAVDRVISLKSYREVKILVYAVRAEIEKWQNVYIASIHSPTNYFQVVLKDDLGFYETGDVIG